MVGTKTETQMARTEKETRSKPTHIHLPDSLQRWQGLVLKKGGPFCKNGAERIVCSYEED